MTKKLFYIAAAAVLSAVIAVSCNKEPQQEEQSCPQITGCWELTDISVKSPKIGDISISVYLEFREDKSFSIYQMIGQGRYSVFEGNYDLYQDETVSGKYSSGKAWGPYSVTVGDKTLTMKIAEGTETDVYTRVDGIPDTVKNNTY